MIIFFAINIVFITRILNGVQLAKFTRTKECPADPMGPKMFPRLNPF